MAKNHRKRKKVVRRGVAQRRNETPVTQHNRRKTDVPPTKKQWYIMGSVSGAAFLGFIGFVWKSTHVLRNHTDWPIRMSPPEWAEVLDGLLFGCIAFGFALFADFPSVISKMSTIISGLVNTTQGEKK